MLHGTKRRRGLGAVVLVAALVMAACGGGEDRPGGGSGSASASHAHEDTEPAFAEHEADTRVDVTATDHAFAMPASVKGGKVLFAVRNDGKDEHEFEVVGADGEPVGGVVGIHAGESKKLAIRLAPGTYTAQCVLKEGDTTHAELGMKSAFTVT